MDITTLSDEQIRQLRSGMSRGIEPAPYTRIEIANEIARRQGRAGGAPLRFSPLLPDKPPSGAEIMQSIAPRPPLVPPPLSMVDERPPASAPESPPGSTPGATEEPPPRPPAPDPIQNFVDRLLSPRGGGSPIPKIPRVDVEKIKGEIPKVGEREAQETYKADPYMTMLQTGLRILAAKPELGQSAISAIAAPVGEGVKEYRGEREKERASKREEAKEARADQYARAEAAKSTAALGMQATTLNTNIALKEAELAQQAASQGETVSLQRARLALDAMKEQQEAVLRRAQADYYSTRNPMSIVNAARPLENRRAEIEARLRERGVPEAEKQTLNSEMARIDRDLGTLRGTLRTELQGATRLETAEMAERNREIARLRELASDYNLPQTTRDSATRRLQEMLVSPPTALPPPPR